MSFYVATDNFALAPLGDRMIVLASPGQANVSPESGTTFPPGPPIDAVWISDGSVTGTRLVAELPEYERANTIFLPVVANGFVFFASSSGRADLGANLWRTDGTPAGTIAVAPYSGYVGGAAPDGRVFFAATTPETGTELWVSDGTPENTHLVKDIHPGPASAFYNAGISTVAAFAGGDRRRVVFPADDGAHGTEPWVSDGTDAGTVLLGDIRPGRSPSAITNPVAMNGAVYFMAVTAPGDWGLWRYVPAP